MIAHTRVETIGRCLPPEAGKFCTLFYRDPDGGGSAPWQEPTELADALRAVLRRAAGRAEEPGAVILDSRTLRSTPESETRGG